jgi:hypothetical protein
MKQLTPIDIKSVSEVLQEVCDKDVHHAVKYISPTHIVRATRARTNGKGGNMEVTLTIGKPNYLERDFIKDCRKVGERFPIRDVVLKFHPVKKKK